MPDGADGGAPEWTRQREGGSALGLRFMRWFALHAPDAAAGPLIWTIALVFVLNRRRPATLASAQYLSRALGRPPTRGELHRHARSFAHVMFDRVRFLADDGRGIEVASQGERLVDARLEQGRGAVLVGAHFGSFEAMRAFDRRLPGLKVRYLMYPDNARKSSELLAELNPEVESRVIALTDGPSAMLESLDALMDGAFVAFLGDRTPDADSRSQAAVTFLGGRAQVPTSPYLAAMTVGAPVLACFAPRLGRNRYEIIFAELYDGAPVPRRERRARAAEMAQAYVGLLEDLCRRHPYNWFNFFDFWGGDDLRGAAAADPRERARGAAAGRG